MAPQTIVIDVGMTRLAKKRNDVGGGGQFLADNDLIDAQR